MVDRKIQRLDWDFEEIVDAHVFSDEEEEDSTRVDDENIDSLDYYNAFLGVLSVVKGSDVKNIVGEFGAENFTRGGESHGYGTI